MSWRNAPTCVLTPSICSPSMTFAFMRTRTKPDMNKKVIFTLDENLAD